MSDYGDETIDAGPEVLKALREQAAKLEAERIAAARAAADKNDAPEPADDQPVRTWQVDDAEDATDDLTTDDLVDADFGAGDDAEDLTDDLLLPNDPTVVLDRLIAEPRVVADLGDAAAPPGAAEHLADDDEDDETIDVDESLTPAPPSKSSSEFFGSSSASAGAEQPPARPASQEPAAPAPHVRVAPVAPVPAVDPDAARDFVRESRERAEAAAREAAPPEPKKRRSGIWLVLAVILGAQIVAGGVYFALTALGGDDEQDADTEEVVADPEDTETSTVPTATTVATPSAVPTPVATPTAVPPTPTWLPVSGGPRSAPFTFLVEAIVNDPEFFNGRDGEQLEVEVDGRVLPLVNPLASGEPLVLRVVGGQPGDDWAQVELPGEAAVAWVRSEQFVWDSTTLLLQVDLFTNSLQVFDENASVYSAAIASGTRDRPTPQLSTYVVEDFLPDDDDGKARIRLADFAERAALSDGLGAMVIETTDDRDAFNIEAGYTTDGRILLTPTDFAQVSRLIAAGTKVEIVGLPAEPTPTPVPEVTGGSSGGNSGGFFGCPPATLGSPPNCYRVVERLTVAGNCAGLQVQFDDECYLIGGNPELDAFGLSCPGNAPEQIGDFCYLRVGPVPELPGPCPEGALDAGDECRQPA